jgi:hypothetical protein
MRQGVGVKVRNILGWVVALGVLDVAPRAYAVGHGTATDHYPAVVAIEAPQPDGSFEQLSGLLISPALVLTVSHGVADHGDGPACPFPLGGHTFLPFNPMLEVRVWRSPTPDFNNTLDIRHTFPLSGDALTRLGDVDDCSESDSAKEVALIQLDTRIPRSSIAPVHPYVGRAGEVPCRSIIDQSGWGGLDVAYGPFGVFAPTTPYGTRNAELLGPWHSAYVDGGTSDYVWKATFGLDLADGIGYGDSGGPLFAVEASGNLIPCGLNSRFYPVAVAYPPFYEIGDDLVGLDSDNNACWLAANALRLGEAQIDFCAIGAPSAGELIGECNTGPEARHRHGRRPSRTAATSAGSQLRATPPVRTRTLTPRSPIRTTTASPTRATTVRASRTPPW